jgi:hypothetical protein
MKGVFLDTMGDASPFDYSMKFSHIWEDPPTSQDPIDISFVLSHVKRPGDF